MDLLHVITLKHTKHAFTVKKINRHVYAYAKSSSKFTHRVVTQCQSSPTFVMLFTFHGHLFATS